MRLPAIFNRDKSIAAQKDRSDAVDKMLTETLRTVAGMFTKMADLIERQRLERSGYEEQEKFLQRTDKKP